MLSREVSVGLGVLAGLLLGGGIAYAATSGTTGSSAGGGTTAAPNGASSSTPVGLVFTGPTADGWLVTVQLSASQSGVGYPALLGDRIRIELPAGAHWSKPSGSTSSVGPESGTGAYEFTLIEPFTVQVTWTDAANTDRTTDLYFGDTFGITFARTTRLATNDYVWLAVTTADLFQLLQSFQTWATSTTATATQRQQVANVMAAAAAFEAAQGGSITPAQQMMLLFAIGPWAEAFAPDIRQIVPFAVGAALPAWAPADDAGATSEAHVLYRYVGPGIAVSALPFPVAAWKRTV